MASQIAQIKKEMVKHNKDDIRRFKMLTQAVQKVPTKEDIEKAVAESVKITVNGKIDKIALHLTEQDKNMEEFRKSLRPWDTTRNWLYETGKIVLYLGGFATAIYAIIKIVMWLSTMK